MVQTYFLLKDSEHVSLSLEDAVLLSRHHNLVLVHRVRWYNDLHSSPLHQLTHRLVVRSTDERVVDLRDWQTLKCQLCLTANINNFG